MTRTQKEWLTRLERNPKKRLRYGAPGMPERTADALVKLGRVKIELQPLSLKPEWSGHRSYFVVITEPAAAEPGPLDRPIKLDV